VLDQLQAALTEFAVSVSINAADCMLELQKESGSHLQISGAGDGWSRHPYRLEQLVWRRGPCRLRQRSRPARRGGAASIAPFDASDQSMLDSTRSRIPSEC